MATALSSTVSTAGAAVFLANPCSPPHSRSPFFSSSLRTLWCSNNNKGKVLELGSQRTAFYVRAEDASRDNAQFPKHTEPLGSHDQGQGKAEHINHTCNTNCLAALPMQAMQTRGHQGGSGRLL